MASGIKVETRKNGRLEVRITGGDAVDQVFLDAMAGRAENGQPVKFTKEDDVFVVSVDT